MDDKELADNLIKNFNNTKKLCEGSIEKIDKIFKECGYAPPTEEPNWLEFFKTYAHFCKTGEINLWLGEE